MDSIQELRETLKNIEKSLLKQSNTKKNITICKWYLQSGRKCKNRGLRDGYCFIHENNYKIRDEFTNNNFHHLEVQL